MKVTPNDIFAMVQQSSGKGKKGACWNCGESDHFSRDCPNDKQDNRSSDGRIREAARQVKEQAKDGDASKSTWNTGETVRAKEKTGTGMASPKNGKVRSDRTIGARQCGKARAT